MTAKEDSFVESEAHMEACIQKAAKKGFTKGVFHAAEIADSFNASSAHPFELGDCILNKLNQVKKNSKPKKNRSGLPKVIDTLVAAGIVECNPETGFIFTDKGFRAIKRINEAYKNRPTRRSKPLTGKERI